MYQKHYLSRLSSVDGQAAFHKEARRSTHINILRSACRDRNCRIPQRMSAQAALELSQSSEMLAISQELRKFPKGEGRREKARLYVNKSRLMKKALEKFQDRWLEQNYDNNVSMPTDNHANDRALALSDQDFDILRPFIRDRSYIADLARQPLNSGGVEQKAAYQALASLCVRDHRVFYRPDESPIAGCCPVSNCNVQIEK
ncbi:MAG: hypothetical protein Q9190_005649 [Brigantiaea leucoxantha]